MINKPLKYIQSTQKEKKESYLKHLPEQSGQGKVAWKGKNEK